MGVDYDTAKRWEIESLPQGVCLNGKVWKKFVEFFRTEKGCYDWTEDEIEFSRNDDDTTEFMAWLVNKLEENNMRFYMAEREAFDELGASETLGDIIRIGFNRIDFIDKDGKKFECWEMSGDNKVLGHRYEDGEYADLELDGDTPIDKHSIIVDRDEDYYTIIQVKELA